MEDGWIKTVDEALNFFGTDAEKGLSLDQVKRNQAKYGLNGEFFENLLLKQFLLGLVTYTVSNWDQKANSSSLFKY